jgi:AcrR family transcriptional regulator
MTGQLDGFWGVGHCTKRYILADIELDRLELDRLELGRFNRARIEGARGSRVSKSSGRREHHRNLRGIKSRESLLSAAIELISEQGFAATSVDSVCRRAGTAKTALYWHFESKDGLLAAVIERVADSWIDEILKSVYLAGTPEERLERVIESFREIVEERPQLLQILLVAQLERSSVSPETRNTLKAIYERAQQAVVKGIEDALGDGLRDLDLVAHSMLALLQAALFHRLMDPEAPELGRLFDEFRRVVSLTLEHRLRRRAAGPVAATTRSGPA